MDVVSVHTPAPSLLKAEEKLVFVSGAFPQPVSRRAADAQFAHSAHVLRLNRCIVFIWI